MGFPQQVTATMTLIKNTHAAIAAKSLCQTWKDVRIFENYVESVTPRKKQKWKNF